jgi:predicted RNA-binding Zn ribbon-like protein
MGSDAAAAADTATFDLSGGHPVLDLVNSLDNRFHPDGPIDLLKSYGDLLRFSAQTGVLDEARVRALQGAVSPASAVRALRALRALRETLAAVLYRVVDGSAPRPADVRELDACFHAAERHRELHWQSAARADAGGHFLWHWAPPQDEADLPLWTLARAASELLVSGEMQRLRACGAETCRWLFLDTSKNHTRRWCNMKVCGNRVKARRFQARHAP